MIEIKAEQPQHFEDIERLLDSVFGTDRKSKAVYSLREGVSAVSELCHVAQVDGELHGAIRYWPVVGCRAMQAPDRPISCSSGRWRSIPCFRGPVSVVRLSSIR